MKIGIVSDSHGGTGDLDLMLSRPETRDVRLWLFAGDVAMDAAYLDMVTPEDVEVIKVAGNNDWPGTNLPDYETLDIAGHTVLLTHGHIFGVNFGRQKLAQAAKDVGADIAVYGHTHVAENTVIDGVMILNPGSIARPRDERNGSFMVMDLLPAKQPVVKLYRL
ncbi:MAG: YfcE family phosphodiesterase [Selenomonas sp.]|nr:YfcE family phosphodiesterase [Selenomonas sp.]